MADASTVNPLLDLWRKQFEESAAAWTRMVEQAPPPPTDPTAFWRPVLNQGLEQWARMFAQTPASPDLATQWKQFLDQWIEAWSRVLEQAVTTLNLASRSQLTAVAKQIVELEERLERVEDGVQAILKRLDHKERA